MDKKESGKGNSYANDLGNMVQVKLDAFSCCSRICQSLTMKVGIAQEERVSPNVLLWHTSH